MNAQQLKNSILQLAIQGELVPQDHYESNRRNPEEINLDCHENQRFSHHNDVFNQTEFTRKSKIFSQ